MIAKTIAERESAIPLLYPGDHLTQEEFHRRYEAYPDETHFELIAGIVYMMAPAGFEHGKSGYDIIGVFSAYEAATPGVLGASAPTVILGPDSEPEPDVVLMIAPENGGQTRLRRVKHKDYIEGAPELVVEVAYSSVAIDLHSKRSDYQRAGVREYIVICLNERSVRWFNLAADKELEIGADGVLKCQQFPGLWIDTRALLHRNANRLISTLQQGLNSHEHQEFVSQLAARKQA